MQNCIKSRKPPQVCPVLNFDGRANLRELLVLSYKILHVWISSWKPRACQKPGGRQMTDPRAAPILLMPHPRTDKAHNAPQLPGGWMGAAGIDWCINDNRESYSRKNLKQDFSNTKTDIFQYHITSQNKSRVSEKLREKKFNVNRFWCVLLRTDNFRFHFSIDDFWHSGLATIETWDKLYKSWQHE